jgi:hypothetical protein
LKTFKNHALNTWTSQKLLFKNDQHS